MYLGVRMEGATGTRAVVWMESGQAKLVADVAARAGLHVIGVGMPRGVSRAEVAEIAGLHEAVGFDDIRHATATIEADLVLIASLAASGDGGPDAQLVEQCRERGMVVTTLSPVPWSTAEQSGLTRSAGVAGPARAEFVPLFWRVRAMANTRDALANLGPVRTMALSMRNARVEGTLGARLYDAMQLVHAVMGVPETIDAAVVTLSGKGSVHLAPADTLPELHGELTANLRFDSGRSATLALSDRSGGWFRGGSIIGEHGCIRFDERGFEHVDISGAVVDESPPKPKPGARKKVVETPSAALMISDQIARMLDPRAAIFERYDETNVLAMCEAALLSARTGQGESPETILRMAGAV